MNQLSFGKTVYLWRESQGLTQEVLAKRAGLSRPNLSMIEQDARDVTLGTARRIASALELEAGILVDGIAPNSTKSTVLGRVQLDRISRCLLGEAIRLKGGEKEIANLIQSITKQKLRTTQTSRTLPKTAREEKRNWQKLKALLRDEEIQNLLSRLDKRSPLVA